MMAVMRVHLGSDHAGFELKATLLAHLRDAGHDPIDCGAMEYDPLDDYPPPCIGARNHTEEEAIRFVDLFLATPFSHDERHVSRLALLAEFEEERIDQPWSA